MIYRHPISNRIESALSNLDEALQDAINEIWAAGEQGDLSSELDALYEEVEESMQEAAIAVGQASDFNDHVERTITFLDLLAKHEAEMEASGDE